MPNRTPTLRILIRRIGMTCTFSLYRHADSTHQNRTTNPSVRHPLDYTFGCEMHAFPGKLLPAARLNVVTHRITYRPNQWSSQKEATQNANTPHPHPHNRHDVHR